MKNLTLRQQEKKFKEILLNHFKEQGYFYFHEYQNSNFRSFRNNILEQLTIYGLSNSKQHSFVQELAFLDIEDLILDIGLPNYDLTSYLLKQNYFFTIRNNHINLSYNTEKRPVETEQDCIEYCQSIIDYVETDGKAFVEKYSYLPNILKEMDRNTQERIYWSHGVFKGITAPFFKGLIISKLCNDPFFKEKIELINNVYYPKNNNLQEFIPYLENLKEQLESIEPIYNFD